MHNLKTVLFLLVSIVMLSLSGCGGGSGDKASTVNDPLAPASTATGTGTDTTPITTQDPTFNLALTTDLAKPTDLTKLPQIDVNIGTVLLTAQCLSVQGGVLINPNVPGGDEKIDPGAPVQNQKIEYKIIAGPGTITYPAYSGATPGSGVVTDSNGKVEAVYTAGNVPFTTNVIIEASTIISGKTYRAYTQFQIVRGSGVIMFTDIAGAAPGTQSNILTTFNYVVKYPAISPFFSSMQLIPFKVTDSNGNPRVGVPVTLYVYSITTPDPNDVTIDFLVPKYIEGVLVAPNPDVTNHNQQTITTDSAGQGIFNVAVKLATPPPGGVNTVVVVYKAVTNDAVPEPVNAVTAYVGNMYTLSADPPPPTAAK